jgi:hypothetical protein
MEYTIKSTDYANRLRALLADGRFAFEDNGKKYATFKDAQLAREYFKSVWTTEKFGIYHNDTLVS